MGELSAKLRSAAGGFIHWCPGCERGHYIKTVADGQRPIWTWDGDVERPTCGPSVRHFVTEGGKERTICHYHLKAGTIEFCGDCAHPLSGQTVPLPDFPKDWAT